MAALEYMEAGKELKTAAANIHDYTSYTAGSVLKKGTELKELGQAQLASAQELKKCFSHESICEYNDSKCYRL